MGIFFESLLVYDQLPHTRGIYHLRDMKARKKIDAIIEFRDDRWIGFEAKPSHHNIDQAAANRVSAGVTCEPSELIIVIPQGPAYQRPDGVWVVPLAVLGPYCTLPSLFDVRGHRACRIVRP